MRLLCLLGLLLPGCLPNQSIFTTRTAEVGSTGYDYKVFVPSNWTPEKKWPVVLFLHGAGERGGDNAAQTRVGLGPVLGARADEMPFVAVFPQCPGGRWWPEPEMQAVALAALDGAMAEFNGDPDRVYLTGISMGGYGAWALARGNPARFAALAPVCGGVVPPPALAAGGTMAAGNSESNPYESVAREVARIPVWMFHGELDRVVPVAESRNMKAALEALGANVRYSEYQGVAHNSWDTAYSEPEFFTWLLDQRNRSSTNEADIRRR